MDSRAERQRQLIAELRSATGRLTARELASRLDVTTRSIRDYVRELNQSQPAPLVLSDQDGYRLDHAEYRRYRARAAGNPASYDRPEQRLYRAPSTPRGCSPDCASCTSGRRPRSATPGSASTSTR